jgi:hypothetical protein
VHRVPVLDGSKIVGILAVTDLARLQAPSTRASEKVGLAIDSADTLKPKPATANAKTDADATVTAIKTPRGTRPTAH